MSAVVSDATLYSRHCRTMMDRGGTEAEREDLWKILCSMNWHSAHSVTTKYPPRTRPRTSRSTARQTWTQSVNHGPVSSFWGIPNSSPPFITIFTPVSPDFVSIRHDYATVALLGESALLLTSTNRALPCSTWKLFVASSFAKAFVYLIVCRFIPVPSNDFYFPQRSPPRSNAFRVLMAWCCLSNSLHISMN